MPRKNETGRRIDTGTIDTGTIDTGVIDIGAIDDAVLALLSLTLDRDGRAWKGFDWDVLDRLYQKGLIGNPVGKAKSVVLTDEGIARSRALFERLFMRDGKA